MSSKNEIKVSVCVVTYNQEKYIAECLQSLVDQETDFPFEIIVGEDCSTDNTREVVRYFSERYPGVIKPIFNSINLGATKNYFNTHKKAQGDYVFHMDGDDLAYPGKLQTQVDYLESNTDVVCCWHRAQVFSDDGILHSVRESKLEEIVNPVNLGLSDFLKYGVLGCHSSLVYRKKYFSKVKVLDGDVLDFYIAVSLLSQGKGANINKVLGGYRFNPRAATASNGRFLIFKGSPLKKLYLSHLKSFSKDYPEYSDCIFFNSLYNSLVELRKMRFKLAIGFVSLALKNVSKDALVSFFSDFVKFRKACR